MPTKTINDLTNTVDILDGDELAFWNLANSRTDKITYANFKADLLGLAADTEILFINGTAIDGDSRLTYNPTTNVFSLQGDFNINGNNIINTGTLTLPTATDTLVGRATTDTLTNKSIDANGTGNIITNIGDAEIEAHTSTKITITAKGQLNPAIVYTDQINTFGAFAQIFPSGQLQLNNLAATFQYIFTGSAILADRAVTLPLLAAPDTFVMEAFAQTLASKTLTSPVINTQISGDITNGGNITTTNFLVGATAAQTLTNKTFDSTSNVWRTSGTSTLTALTTISRGTNNLDLNNLLITDTLITSSVNLNMSNNNITSVDTISGGNEIIDINTNDVSIVNSSQNGTFAIGELAWTGSTSLTSLGITWNRTTNGAVFATQGFITFQGNAGITFVSATEFQGTVTLADFADVTFSTSKLLTRDAGGVVNTIVASGGAGTDYLDGSGNWSVPGGAVNISGTPVNNQIAIWTNSTTIEGDDDFTYNADAAFRSFLVTNPNTGVGESMRQVIEVNGTDASSDPFIAFNIGANGATSSYSLGIDNSNADAFVINHTNGGTASPVNDSIMNITTLLAGSTASHAVVWSPHMRGATGNQVGFSIEPVVNKLTSGTYTAFKIDVTETDVNTGNILMDIGIGGFSQFIFFSAGDIQIPDGQKIGSILGNTFLQFDSITTTLLSSANNIQMQFGGNDQFIINDGTTNIVVVDTNSLTLADAVDLVVGTTTGTKIGTATTQKLGFFNSTPIIQQTTTSQTPATFVANSSGIVDDTGTWNGYTIGDLVAILQAFGFIA